MVLIRQVIEQEEQARQALLLQNRPMLEDKVCRSWGSLKTARIISSQEAIELFSKESFMSYSTPSFPLPM